MMPAARGWGAPALVLGAGAVAAAAMSWLAHLSPVAAATALLAVYAFGFVSGALLVDRRDDVGTTSWVIIRLVSGLLLTTISFLLCLVWSLPWFAGPVMIFLAAVTRRGRSVFSLPRLQLRLSRDGLLAGLLAACIVSPIAISAIRMAPGDFPPVFYNVDTAYSLEQVHTLVKAVTYPPASLSNVGGRRTYHFGITGMAALITRTAGLAPHHSLFLIVLPLLTMGILAAAIAAARSIAPAVPLSLGMPILLISVPSFWYSFWDYAAPLLWTAASSPDLSSVRAITENYELWGAASIVAQNVGAHFVVLASLAGLAAAPSRGWRLPVFLIGTAIVVKASTGVALAAGLFLAQAFRAVADRAAHAFAPAIGVTAVFFATYATFWMIPPIPPEFGTEFAALFHLTRINARDGLPGLAADIAWVLLPALVIAFTGVRDPERRSAPLFLLAVAPFVVVNLTQSIDRRPGGGGATDDWLQVLLPAPFVFHAFVLSVAGSRWTRLQRGMRAVFVLLLAASILPATFVAARYSYVLVRHPENGHEFVDNRSIAEALATVPLNGTLVVTNDLRYPAQRFTRDNRQMQIPALFGHQAFAVNYAYEVFSFSRERRALQQLLQAPEWSEAISDTARAHGWTHLLIRKDYVHPAPIPLERVFENASYAVYRFEASTADDYLPTIN